MINQSCADVVGCSHESWSTEKRTTLATTSLKHHPNHSSDYAPVFPNVPSSSGIRKRHVLSTRATKQTEDIEVSRYLPSLRRFICKSCDEQWLAKTVNRLSNKNRRMILIYRVCYLWLREINFSSAKAPFGSCTTCLGIHTWFDCRQGLFDVLRTVVKLSRRMRRVMDNCAFQRRYRWSNYDRDRVMETPLFIKLGPGSALIPPLYPPRSFDMTLNIYYSVPRRHNFQSGSIC